MKIEQKIAYIHDIRSQTSVPLCDCEWNANTDVNGFNKNKKCQINIILTKFYLHFFALFYFCALLKNQ